MEAKHKVFAGIIIVLGLIGIFAFLKISAVTNLQVALSEITIDQVSWTDMHLNFEIVIQNPNVVSVTIDRFHARLYANKERVATVELLDPVKIPPGGTITKEFNIVISYLEVGEAIISAIRERKIEWTIEGEYFFRLFGITIPYTFEMTQ